MINNSFWTIIFTVQLKGISLMDVAHGPSFIYEPPARVLISSGSGGTVPCSAHGIPPPSLSWLDSMEQPVSVIKGLREVLQNGTLWFPQFNARDYNAQIHEQEYRCVATNPAGVIVSRHSSISTVMSGFQFSLTVYSVSVEVGNIALMKCGGGREYIDVIGWMRDSDELHTSGRILITTAGDLHIKDVQFTDSIYHYSCKYRNKISGEETLSKPGSIKVTESRGSSLNRPDTVNSAFRVKVGGSIDLPCVGQGYPPPVYSWYKMNQLTGNQEPLNASPSLFPRDSVLSIVGARRTDSGRYICKIHNSVSQFLVEHQLEVYSPLSSYVNPSYIVSDYGRTAIINCTVDGAPVLNVFWLKDGQIVMPSQRIRLTPTTLTIRNVMSSDGGMYQCLAVNEEEESQATAQLVLGSQPPVFNYVFPKEVHQEGPKISLRCEVSGNPPPSISWFLDQHRISFGSGRSLILHQNTGFVERVLIGQYLSAEGTVISHLNISTVLSTDGGLYRCVAKNSVGSVEHSARLNIYGPPTSRGRLNQTAVAGSDVLLVCPVSGYPIHKVEWSTQHQIIKGPRPAPLTNGSLLIRNVEKNDNIEYSCTAYSDGQGSATAYVVLIVIEAPKISPFAFDGDLKEGDRSQVSCTISSGDLPISIRWEKNGNQLEASKNVQIQSNPFSSSIFFFSLTAAHSGSYTCLAENSADVSNFTAQLIVKVSPHWLVEPANQTVVYHESVVINCQAGGNPRPTISWRRSTGNLNSVYEYVQTSDGNIQFHPNGSLVLKAVRQSDEGFYRCEVQNGVGEIKKEIYLDVQVPVYFEHFKANRTAIVNQDAALVCNPFGDHPIRVVWRRGEQELNGKQDRFSFASANSSEGVMNTLTIRNVQRQDGREYTCFASNRFGSQYLTVQLAVYEPPEPPSSLYVSDLTSRSMVLSWYPAFDGNSPVLHYLVQFKPQAVPWREAGNITVSREHSYTRLDGLLPNNIYLLRVISVNSIGLGPPSLEIVAQTKEEVPSGSPVSVRVEAVSSTQILVSWQPPREDDRNGILLGYSVRYGELNSEHLTKKTVRSVSTTELRLSGLVPFTKYQVMVNAFNSIGAGPTSSRSIISTHEAVPGSPPEEVRCEPVSPSLLSISWKPPVQNMNGIVLGYSVTYRRENLVGGKDAIKEVKVGGLYTSITDLETYTSYYIKVAAFTKVGKGVSSEKLICTTGQDVPSAPEDVKAVVVSADSIKLSWRPPAWRNGDILSYSIFTQVDRQTSTTTVAATETEFLIKDLRERQHYEFWVVARTAIGEGGKSKVTSGSPTELVPARIISFSSTLNHVVGGTVNLPCEAVGTPTPKLSWTYRGVSVFSDEKFFVQPDGSLIIRSISEYMDRITCQVENEFGEDRIHYSIDIVAAPNAPTIRLESSDLDSITISWHLPHNGGALIQGYFLNYKMVGSDWTEISLDYDLLTFTLQDLPCGSTFLVNLVAHNIAGRSKPSATLTSSTQGSVPGIPDLNSMLSVNSTSILLHLYGWPDGGCTVHYFVVQYRELTQDTWRVLSSNIRSAEEDVLISDLSPSTRYILQLTAQNTAGNRLVTGHVATLTLTGHTLPPWSSTTQQTITDQVDGSLAIPIILSIIIVSTALLLSIYCFKRRQFVSYPGYTPTLNQYSVKSLSDIPTGNVHVYTPLTIQRIRKAESNQRIDASTGTPYNAVPYAVYRSPNVQPPDKDVDYSSPLFQTFGRTLDSTKSLIRTPDSSQTFIRTPDSIQSFVRTPDTTKTLLSRPNSVHLAGFNLNNIRGPTDPISLEISSISRQLHPTHTQTLGRNTQRFSMCSETDSTEENTLNKFATLRRSRRYSSREASDLLSDSSTESAVEIIKQQARLTRRNKRSKQARRCRSQSSLEDMDNQISTFTRLSTDSRELTEPECDRDITEFTTLQAQIRNQLEKIREQDIVKPAGISHQNSWNTANQRHLEEKFVIKV